jgi:hypothetical protein
MSKQTDFHQLDTCFCGGTLDCFTTRYNQRERRDRGYTNAVYRTEWICQKCGDVSDQLHDKDMHDLTSKEAFE